MEKANEQTLIIERDLARVEGRLERHIEVYAQNGKEMARLAAAVESLKDTYHEETDRHRLEHVEIWKQIRTNVEDINNIEIDVSRIITKVGIYAGAASFLASTTGVLLIERFLL